LSDRVVHRSTALLLLCVRRTIAHVASNLQGAEITRPRLELDRRHAGVEFDS
jgi:hypothetical protein